MTTQTKNRLLDFIYGNLLTVLIMAAAIIYSNGQKDLKMEILVQDGKKNEVAHEEIKRDLKDAKDKMELTNIEITKIAKDIDYLKKDKENFTSFVDLNK